MVGNAVSDPRQGGGLEDLAGETGKEIFRCLHHRFRDQQRIFAEDHRGERFIGSDAAALAAVATARLRRELAEIGGDPRRIGIVHRLPSFAKLRSFSGGGRSGLVQPSTGGMGKLTPLTVGSSFLAGS